MKISILILTLLIFTSGFSQEDSIPENILVGDTLFVEIKKVGCHVSYNQKVRITQNDNKLQVDYISSHTVYYLSLIHI